MMLFILTFLACVVTMYCYLRYARGFRQARSLALHYDVWLLCDV